ncbi:MAG: TrmH family RNA methyltransferase [Lachnospiraceae bacterium]|nr:TrmH family RNA methyltransferase [Lachnospiraceae bacterium]
MEIKKYKKETEYSYTLGAFPTLELVDAMPDKVIEILVHSSFTDKELVEEKCRIVYEAGKTKKPIVVKQDNKLIDKLSDKENVYVVGIFEKYICELSTDTRHIVLVNPSNMGNLGTIIRTACGFGYYDLAVIEPAADIFNPKTVRASMGSLFRIRHEIFGSFDEYAAKYSTSGKTIDVEKNNAPAEGTDTGTITNENGGRMFYPFMLDGSCSLKDAPRPNSDRFSLIFGNEATGLPKEFSGYGCPVRIEQTEFVDSLNLTIAAGIGMYKFAND